jgi:hypothetical protein
MIKGYVLSVDAVKHNLTQRTTCRLILVMLSRRAGIQAPPELQPTTSGMQRGTIHRSGRRDEGQNSTQSSRRRPLHISRLGSSPARLLAASPSPARSLV